MLKVEIEKVLPLDAASGGVEVAVRDIQVRVIENVSIFDAFLNDIRKEVTAMRDEVESDRQEVATNTASVASMRTETKGYRDETLTLTQEVRTKHAEVESDRQEVATNTATTKGYMDTTKGHMDAAKASQDASKLSENNAKASEIKATQEADRSKSEADRAEVIANSMVGGVVDMGAADLSGGVYPAPFVDQNGNKLSCFWYVTKGGTVDGVDYGIGDVLRYTSVDDIYYKVDNTDAVTSVNGEKGVVTVTPDKIGAVKKSGDTLTGGLILPSVTVSDSLKWNKPNGGSVVELTGDNGTAAFINWGSGHNAVRFNKGATQSENSSDFYGQLRENGARVYSPNNKPTWIDIGGNNYWAINASQPDRLEAQAKWVVAAPSRGVIPAASGDGLLGTTGTRWRESWVNVYRGSHVDIGGHVEAGAYVHAGSTIFAGSDQWKMGLVASSSANKGVVGLTHDDGATFSDYIRIGANRELVHHVTVNNQPEEYDVYTEFNRPDAAAVGAVAKTGDTMTGQLVVPSVVTQEADSGGLWCGDRQAVYGHVTSTWLYLNNKGHFTSGVFLGGQGVARHDSAFTVGSWTLDGATLLRKGQALSWGTAAQAALSMRHADSTSAVWMLGSYADDQSNTMRAGLQIMRNATGEMRLYTNNLTQYLKVSDGQLYMSNPSQLNSPYAATRKGYVDDLANTKVNKAGDTMTGALTVQGNVYAKEFVSEKLSLTSEGAALRFLLKTNDATSNSWLEWVNLSGVRQGYMGVGSTLNNDISIGADVGDLRLISNSAKNVIISKPITDTAQGTEANALTRRDFVENLITQALAVHDNNLFPVGHSLVTVNPANPTTYGYPGTWELEDGDVSLVSTNTEAELGLVSGENNPVVPVPQHSHGASFKGNALPAHEHSTDTPSNTALNSRGGWSNGGATGSSGSQIAKTVPVSAGTPSGTVTVNNSGTANATLDVRGKHKKVYIWTRTA
ncbi:hypothetical protein [Vibrio fluvialis]|uniref:hypothetical protein n=1 Tax=Vibrio fluvialis TaxID=676 RepID=UPI0028E08182|nr:hypothetical protein [Vibrio fluvialis]MDT8865869.1 hypothetical protein [Vibrio fluvialis]MDT8873637.1 hypothetical protein [Vibrio fluvialis]